MTLETPTPVYIAEEILRLTQSAFAPPSTDPAGAHVDPLALYDAKIRMQDLCDTLLQSVLGRLEYTVLLAESCQESSALGFVTTLGIADIIGDGTASVDELSDKSGADAQFLSIAMSCLSKHGYFEEVGGFGTKIYRNNALSEILREGHPESVKDAVGFVCDEGFKATSYLSEASKPVTEGEKRLPAVNIAFGFKKSVFEWMSDQEWRGRRMGKAMQQLHRMANGNVVSDYPWTDLASPVVDVGGGIGSLEIALLKHEEAGGANTELRFNIFDIPRTIKNARKTWMMQPAGAAARVSFTTGNFLAPSLNKTSLPRGQPTYLIRHVLHDWTDDQVMQILGNVRQAMLAPPSTPNTAKVAGKPKLVLCEMLLRASSARFVRTTSMQLLALNNGFTRTETEMVRLVEKSGFAVDRVHHMRAVDSIIEASPV
ncbi:O-methyltransferase SfmM3 [Hypsizygus marmoreus]|uniref:O-methyltransferase SfmM3 n=1 Tax=Hypsizygus marmoreus TaxID=39966 RepID=A0A369JBC2_HYPMA|nr:O-methyltransferase SfmM3 [Hypsizygus marmoreus]